MPSNTEHRLKAVYYGAQTQKAAQIRNVRFYERQRIVTHAQCPGLGTRLVRTRTCAPFHSAILIRGNTHETAHNNTAKVTVAGLSRPLRPLQHLQKTAGLSLKEIEICR